MIENLFSMSGKVCVVTGGSSGLGSYMAQGFLEAGAARVYISARSEEKLTKKAEEWVPPQRLLSAKLNSGGPRMPLIK